MPDGHINKCIECTKWDNKTSNGTQERECVICKIGFNTTLTEVKRGGGNCCSRKCWYKHFKENVVNTEEKSPNWKGDDVGKEALHNWVQKHLGKPKECEQCHTTTAKQYDWANISQEYKRDLSDWKRLCRSCHAKYDYPTRSKKWKLAVQKHGWNVTKIN